MPRQKPASSPSQSQLQRKWAAEVFAANAIAPGFIETPMTQALSEEVRKDYFTRIPLGRFGTSTDVANAVVFLAGSGASYINGTTIVVDGGLL